MNNSEKYKTAEGRARAFNKYCDNNSDSHGDCKLNIQCHYCHFVWLDSEAEEEEKPLPCPFCGNNLVSIEYDNTSPMSYSVKCCCGYSSERTPDKSLTIYKHNQVARAAMKEVKNEAD